MKKLISLLILSCCCWSALSQTYDREWATYFGDSSLWISGIAESEGNLFIVGKTTNSSYTETMTSSASFQPDYGGGETDGFMAKISEDGQLLWFTFYGGAGKDEITDIIINEDTIYLVGKTSSEGLATNGVHQTSLSGIADGFIAAFDVDGNRNWHTYSGGEGEDEVISVVTDNGKLFVHGRTSSHTGIATPDAFQETIHPEGMGGELYNNYIAAFTATGTKLWGSYYGLPSIGPTSFHSHPPLTGIAINKTGLYVSGWDTQPIDNTYYGTPGSFMETKPGPVPLSLYISKFNEEGQRLWSTYYSGLNANGMSTSITPQGGAGEQKSYHNLTTTAEGVYMSGRTPGVSVGTEGSFQPSKTGFSVPFVVNFSNQGNLLWGSYLGNNYGTDTGSGGYSGSLLNGLIKDSENNIYMAGSTNSTGDIATPDGFQLEKGNYTSSFVAKITPDGTSKIYATYYGGEMSDSDGKAIPVENGDSFYLTGTTTSTFGMTTSGAWQENFISGGEVEKNIFIVKFTDEDLLNVNTTKNIEFVLYPNPVKDYLNIRNSTNTPVEISLFSTTGQKLVKQIISPSQPLDLSAFPVGIYLGEIIDFNGNRVKKVKVMKL